MNRTISSSSPHDLLAELFIATREEKGCSPLTIRNYRLSIGKFLTFYDQPIEALKPDHVILWLQSLRQAGMSPSLRAWYQRHLFAWLRWLYARGDVERDPLRGVSSVQVPSVQHSQVSNDDFVRLLTVATAKKSSTAYRDMALIRMLWATGLRRAEICSLDLEDIDLQQLTAVVMGKGQKQRTIPFDHPTKRALLEYFHRERGKDDGPLFQNTTGERLTGDALRLTIGKLSKLAGVPASAHSFRRGFARRMRRSGLDLGETAALMGHSTLVMTRAYSQVGEQEAAIEAYRRVTAV